MTVRPELFQRIVGLFLMMAVAACASPLSDVEQVRRVVDGAAAAANERKLTRLHEMIAPEYEDSQGRRLAEIHGLIASTFYYRRDLFVRVRGADIRVEGDRADARVQVLFGRRRQADPAVEAFLEDGAAYVFDVGFARREAGWLVVEAVWRPVGEQ